MNKKTNRFLTKMSITILMTIIAFFMLLPLLWMVSASLKFESDVFVYPIKWIPERWHAIENYRTVIVKNSFLKNYMNSIIHTSGVVILSMIFGSMCAYALTRIVFPGRDIIFKIMLAMLMIPPQLTLIPRFMIVMKLGMYDTLTSLILMESFSIYGVFMLRQFMISIPNSLCESAKIDGAGHMRTYLSIILPLMKPALATLGILKTVWTWNDFQGPLVFLSSKSKFTVQLAVQQFALSDGLTPIYSLIMTGSVLATIPLIIVFIIFQSQVVEGISLGAVKG
jgi:multiple sugar transport system permease protein